MERRLGKYELVSHLASGGMASVYLARISGLGGFQRHVVLKTLDSTQLRDENLVSMFLDEARLVAQLHHQHIAQVYEVGCEDGTYYLAMEYVHGETVRHVLEAMRDRGRPLPLDFCLSVVCAAAAGLHHAHERRAADGTTLDIVHRDVTPSNVIASYDGSIKLIDFGIAKANARTTVTQSGLIKGKVGYMAPEQVRGFPVDRRSDVFALGVLAYELTTQTRAFDGASQFEQLERTARGDLIPPSQIVADYPRSLERLIMRALEVDPDDRFPSALAMRVAVAQVASELGLSLGEAPIMRVLAELFGYRPEPWLHDPRASRRRRATSIQTETPPVTLIDPQQFARGTRDLARLPDSVPENIDDDAETDPIELVEVTGCRELVRSSPEGRTLTVQATESPSQRASTVPALDTHPPPVRARTTTSKPPPIPPPRRISQGTSPPAAPTDPTILEDSIVVEPPPVMPAPEAPCVTPRPSQPFAPMLPDPPRIRTATPLPTRRRWRGPVIGGALLLALGIVAALVVIFVDDSGAKPRPAVAVVGHPPETRLVEPAPAPVTPAPARPDPAREMPIPRAVEGDAAMHVPRVVETSSPEDVPAAQAPSALAAGQAASEPLVAVVVTTDPPDATVVLDGVRLGRTPLTVDVPIKHGQAWLKVRKPGHRAIKTRVSLEQDVTWDVRLQPTAQ